MKQKEVLLKPAPGCKVRDPITKKFLADEGEYKPLTMYWRRRIRMFDVIKIAHSTVVPKPGTKKT